MKKQFLKANPQVFFIVLSVVLLFVGCQTRGSVKELAEVYYNLGNAYSDLGRSNDAEAAYKRAFRLKSDFSGAGYALARAYVESGKYADGIAIFKDLLKKNPDNMLLKEALAWGYYKEGKSEKAVLLYRDILEKDGFNKDVLFNISVILTDNGDYGKAYVYLKKLDSLGDADALVYTLLGKAEAALEISSGSSWFEKASNENPGDKEILSLLAEAYVKDKRYDSALKAYDKILEGGKDLSVLFKKAFILLTAIEDYDKGLKSLEAALAGGFKNEKEISKLKNYPDLLYPDRINSILKKYE